MGELIASLDNYSIYKAYSDKSGDYYLCVPNGNIVGCQIFLGFSDKDLETLSNDEVISMISAVNNTILGINNNSMYVVPNIKFSVLEQAALENDDPMYLNILNNSIQPIMGDVYNMLIKNGIKPKDINQVIQVIEKNDRDKKIGGWLSMKLGEQYINEINYHDLVLGHMDKSSEQVHDNYSVFDSGIAPVNHDYDNVLTNDKKNTLVRRLTKPKDTSLGFSSFKFIIVTLLLSLVVGTLVGYLIMK